MKLHNIMEDEVIDLANQLMDNKADICNCERCKLDVLALSLNELQPKYVVTNEGGLLGRANLMTRQFNADMVKELTKAIDFVSKNPRHELED